MTYLIIYQIEHLVMLDKKMTTKWSKWPIDKVVLCFGFCIFLHFFMFFSLFLVFSCFFGAFYYKNTMDECRHKTLVVLVFTMAIHQVVAQVVSLQQVVITQHWSMTNLLLFFSKIVETPPRLQSIWKYERFA